MGFMSKLLSFGSDKDLKRYYKIVDKINGLEPQFEKMTEEELRAQTDKFRERYANGESLDDMLPEAFATVREASKRTMGMRHFDVQLIGAMALHEGHIAEMKTGEGKTLVAILPAYLNALTGNGVHIVTVNDYLAKRDSEWMGKVYRFLGLSVGLIIHDLTAEQRRAAYAADITYGTNNELGFDYLRDNMAIYKQEMVQRGHAFAIVDEVDSILIDEARTPLIISGKGEESSKLYEMADFFVSRLKKQVFSTTDDKELQDQYDCDYIVDEKDRTVSLTQKGIEKAEQFFNVENLADPENATLSHHINQAMKARGLMKKDIDYVVKDGEVVSTQSARQYKDATDLVMDVAGLDCRNASENGDLCGTLQKGTSGSSLNSIHPVRNGLLIRRLTPLECERLQGFLDGWTNIPNASDSARYKALGNSVAIPCVEFIMGQIAAVPRAA